MKNFRQVLTITANKREQYLNLSYDVEECVRRSMINNGICVVFSQHTTSSVFLENDSEALHADRSRMLSAITDEDTLYKVDYMSAGAAHMKQALLGASVTIPISDGRLELGPRQYIIYADFDGGREKSVIVKIIGE